MTISALYSNLRNPQKPASQVTLYPSGLVSIVGRLKAQSFPVTEFGPPEASNDTRQYWDLDVLVIERREGNQSTSYYLYCPGFHQEMLLAKSGGSYQTAGLTLDEINDAFLNGLSVEVNGSTSVMHREGRDYPIIEVRSIKVLETEKAPLIIYSFTNDTIELYDRYEFSGRGGGRVQMPQSFTVDNSLVGINSSQVFQVLLNKGDAVGFEFNSTRPISFRMMGPTETDSGIFSGRGGATWYELTNITSLRSGLMALRRGEYYFVFSLDYKEKSNATFNLRRVSLSKEDVLFTKSCSIESGFGGMSWFSTVLSPPPKRFVVGRTWGDNAWGDASWSFNTTLHAGALIDFGFNATEPIEFSFSGLSGAITATDSLYYYHKTYEIPSTGNYVFNFGIDKPKTAIVAFRCKTLSGEPVYLKDEPAATIGLATETNEPKFDYSFPPAINGVISLNGKLVQSDLPDIDGKVMLLETAYGARFFLHLGVGTEMLPAPVSGFTMLGDVSLFDVNDAYQRNLTVSVHGFPFDIVRNGTVYHLFHLNSIDVLGSYRLYAVQSVRIDGASVEYFPLNFSLALDYYNGNGWNFERFYSVYLKKGDTIRISFNSSNPVEFGAYWNSWGMPSTMPFSLGRPEDYLIRESNIRTLNQVFTASRGGYYTFAFKAIGGEKASVLFSLDRID